MEYDEMIAIVKGRQLNGVIMRCPRCGLETLWKPTRNALSRYLDVYVCDTCGTHEALSTIIGVKEHFEDWYINDHRNEFGIGE